MLMTIPFVGLHINKEFEFEFVNQTTSVVGYEFNPRSCQPDYKTGIVASRYSHSIME